MNKINCNHWILH